MPVWITDSQDEQSLEELFRDADQVHVPIFQRSYIWKIKEFNDLRRDIELIRDEIEESQFMGAIVTYERPRPSEVVGRLRALDVVDGQQRLLTLYIFVMALVEHTSGYDKDLAVETVREFLLLQQRRGLEINTRVVPAYDDRNQFRALWDRINSPDVLQAELQGTPPLPPSPSGNSTGNITLQYNRIHKYIQVEVNKIQDDKIAFLRNLIDVVTGKLTFVHLKLNDGSVAMKIFERLNFRGVKVGIVDLVRNEVFARIGNRPTEAFRLFENEWKPLIDRFNGSEDAFFFPYCLVQNSNITKSELFAELRRIWGEWQPPQIIHHMVEYQQPFLSIEMGGRLGDNPEINTNLNLLYRMRCPSVVYPFIIKVLHEYERGELSEILCADILRFVEAFLVRRSIVGFEPTGLHALFKGLWNEISGDPCIESIANMIDRRGTVQRPTDEAVREAVRTRSIAKTKIFPYLLEEYDRSLPGDNPLDKPSIEHILPQTYASNGPWANLFSPDQHKELKDVWANLVPLSTPLNSSLQARGYETKRQRYLEESMFQTPRMVASRWGEWTIESIRERGILLADWTVQRWPNFI